jgi:hypothetical protein
VNALLVVSFSTYVFYQDFGNDCIRLWWTGLFPLTVVVFNLCRIALRHLPERPWHLTFSNFLPLEEAIYLMNDKPIEPINEQTKEIHERETFKWKTGSLVVPAFFEIAYWVFSACRQVILAHGRDQIIPVFIITPILLALSWLYACIRPLFIRRRAPTVPYDLFAVYLSMLAVLGLDVGSIIYKRYAYTHDRPTPETNNATVVVLMLHFFALSILLGTVLSLPMAVPPPGVNRDQIGKTISPEDYTPFWGWITFFWVYPLVKRVSQTRSVVTEAKPGTGHGQNYGRRRCLGTLSRIGFQATLPKILNIPNALQKDQETYIPPQASLEGEFAGSSPGLFPHVDVCGLRVSQTISP